MPVSRIHSIEVPSDERGILASLLRLTDPALSGLERALAAAKPTLDKNDLVSQLRAEPDLADVADLEEILSSLLNIAGTAYAGSVSTTEIAEAVIKAIKADDVIELSDEDAAKLANLLARLANLTSLEIVAKGSILLRANDRNFSSVRIISDLRPICSGDDLTVAAGVIVHQFAIRSRRNNKAETIYFSLSPDDLVSVNESIARALKKEKALRDFADKSGSPILALPKE